jgi:predicted nucleotidyltransferase component of viral defense system
LIEIIRQRLASFAAADAREERQATKEILQEVALYLLWRADFFQAGAFQGGTSLRILHQLPRFSEDLDFILHKPDATFVWQRYLKPLTAGLEEFGLQSEVLDKSRTVLNLKFAGAGNEPPVKIKLEIDVNPPAGSGFAHTYLDFPLDFEVCHQDLPSNFALKLHALLCRPYLKGRDWYDFNWYIKQKTRPNLPHLQAALDQAGPWQGTHAMADTQWVVARLHEKAATIDWSAAAADVERFLGPAERASLKLWSTRFFAHRIEQLNFA